MKFSSFLNAGRKRMAIFETYFDGDHFKHMNVSFFTYRPTRYATWNGQFSSPHNLGASLYSPRMSMGIPLCGNESAARGALGPGF